MKFNTYRQGRFFAGALDGEKSNKIHTKSPILKKLPDEKAVEKVQKTASGDGPVKTIGIEITPGVHDQDDMWRIVLHR